MECSFLPKAINYSFLYYDIIYAIQGCLLLINNTMIINFSLASLNVLRVASSSLEFSLIIISSSRYGTNQGAIDIRMIQAFKTTVWIQIRYNGNKFFNDKYAETCCKRILRKSVILSAFHGLQAFEHNSRTKRNNQKNKAKNKPFDFASLKTIFFLMKTTPVWIAASPTQLDIMQKGNGLITGN